MIDLVALYYLFMGEFDVQMQSQGPYSFYCMQSSIVCIHNNILEIGNNYRDAVLCA